MFEGASSFKQNIKGWNISSVEEHTDMFGVIRETYYANTSSNTVIDLINHKEESWGVKMNTEGSWRILRVDEGGQFDKMGVKVGWQVIRVNHMETHAVDS